MSEYQKFCTSCGSPLDPGQRFCTTCGAAVVEVSSDLPSNSPNPSVSGNTSPMPAVGPNVSSYPGDTQVLNSQDVQNRQYRQPPMGSVSVSPKQDSDAKKPIFIVLIVVLAVAVLILVGVLLSNLFGGQQNSSSISSTTTEESQSTNSNQAATNNSSSGVTDSDRELYSTLSSYYSRLGDYDQRIASAAKTFNADYVSNNMSVRSADASSAYALAEEIADDYNALKNLSVPSTSRYASCYSAMLTCYYDCTQRIGAISESWDISLQYSDPTGHEDEICAPLSRDRSGDNNKYYTEFKQTYPSAKPQSPTA